MQRREFVKAFAIGSAFLLTPWPLRVYRQPARLPPRSVPPRLWGDGIHDDTHAIQARLDQGDYALPPATYLVMGPLVFRSARNLIANSYFRVRHEGAYLMMTPLARENAIMGCTWDATHG